MLAERFLDELEARGMLGPDVISDLRRQVSEMDRGVTPEAVAKLLVDHGHITKFQATTLVTDVTQGIEKKRERKAKDRAKKASKIQGANGSQDNDEEIVDLMATPSNVDDLVPMSPASAPAPANPTPPSGAGLTPLESSGGLAPMPGDQPAGLTPMDGGLTPMPTAPAAGGLTPMDASGGLEPMGGDLQPMDAPMGGGLEPTDGPAPEDEEPEEEKRGYRRRTEPENKWTGLLIMIGLAVLLVLVLLAGILYWNLTAGTAQVYYDNAAKHYDSESYSQAEKSFQEYFENASSSDKNQSMAKMLYAMSRIRQLKRRTDPTGAKKKMLEILPEIFDDAAIAKEQEVLDQARDELPSLVIDILEGFATQANAADEITTKQSLVEGYEDTIESIWNAGTYVPTSRRKAFTAKIEELNERINLAKYDIAERSAMDIALTEIDASLNANDTVKAFQIRSDYLRRYPRAEERQEIVAATTAISHKERGLVKVSETPIKSRMTEETTAKGHMSVLLASRIGKPIVGIEDEEVIFVLVEGTVYALKAATGQVLWNRTVGFDTTFHPVPVSSARGADAIVVDGTTHEIMRLKADTGELVWACPVGEPVNDPVVNYGRIIATTKTGRVLKIDPNSGVAGPNATVPQELLAGPGFDQKRPWLYLVGNHSNLYRLSADTLDCESVIPLGHKPGTIEIPPTLAIGLLFVPENAAPNRTELHVFRVGDGTEMSLVQTIRLKGNVVTSPVLAGRRLVYITDLREIHVFSIDPNNKRQPVSTLAVEQASLDQPMVTHAAISDTTLVVADRRFAKHEIRLTTSELQTPLIVNEGETFDGPVHIFGKRAAIHQRRPELGAGMTITAANISGKGEALWTTYLGQPIINMSVNKEEKLFDVLTSGGTLFKVRPQDLSAGAALDKPAETEGDGVGIYDTVLELGNSKVGLFSSTDQRTVILYDPAAKSTRLRQTRLSMGESRVSGPATSFDGGLLLPLESGELIVLNYQTGAQKLDPFLPEREPNQRIKWSAPALMADGKEILIADNQKNLFRVGLSTGARPSLKRLQAKKLTTSLVPQLAGVGEQLYGVMPDPAGDVLVRFSRRNLREELEFGVDGRVFWGPQNVGGLVFIASRRLTDAEAGSDQKRVPNELICFDGGDKPRWRVPLPYGPLAGLPLADGSEFILASVSGVVWRISGATGEELAKVEIGEGLQGTPVALGSKLMLPGAGGALHMIDVPK